jgi:nucleoside-diphosphate-sugar epimerase
MSILVTGGSGLIGTWVVRELLERGEDILVLDLKPTLKAEKITFIKGTVTDKDFLVSCSRKYKIEKIVHLAGLLQFDCERRPSEAIEVNVLGTLNLLEVARIIGVKRFVFASSCAVYGPTEEAVTENTPILPGVGMYGATKRLCEVLGCRYHKVHAVPFVSLRYRGVYGPGIVSSPGMAEVFKRIESSITGKDIVVEEAGAQEKHHFTFVKDAAYATVLALDASLKDPCVFNIAGGEDSYVTFQEFYQMIKKLYPSAGNVLFRGKGQNRGQVDISAARKELNYSPKYTLEMGIQEDINYWRSLGSG